MVLSRMYERQHSFFHSKEYTKTISDKKKHSQTGCKRKTIIFQLQQNVSNAIIQISQIAQKSTSECYECLVDTLAFTKIGEIK